MAQDVDLNKVVRQHLEMESFFTGFAVKGKPFAASGSTSNREVAESRAEEQSVVSESPAPGEPLPAENLERQKQEPIRTVSVDAVKELEAIAAEARQCRKCELGGLRTNAVPGEGNPQDSHPVRGRSPGGG